jgi:SAM-dependent methyltransferase
MSKHGPGPETNTNRAERFWDDIYRTASPNSNGQPSLAVKTFIEHIEPGCALDLGCARGDDAVWLARKGWKVVAVDISGTALRYAQANAGRADVKDRIDFQQHDLAKTFPEGRFDLVTAIFLQSPIDFPRATVLNRAANVVSPCGHLLIVEHASRASWSWSAPDTRYPDPEEGLALLELRRQDWVHLHAGAVQRRATGPEGQIGVVRDNVILLKRI